MPPISQEASAKNNRDIDRKYQDIMSNRRGLPHGLEDTNLGQELSQTNKDAYNVMPFTMSNDFNQLDNGTGQNFAFIPKY